MKYHIETECHIKSWYFSTNKTLSLAMFLTVLAHVSISMIGISSVIGRVRTVFPLSDRILTSAFLTWSSDPAMAFTMVPIGHWFLQTVLSLTSTISPSFMSRYCVFHFRLGWSNGRYSLLQRVQNVFARACTLLHSARYKSFLPNSPSTQKWKHNLFSGLEALLELRLRVLQDQSKLVLMGLELIIAQTSAINVFNTSCVRFLNGSFMSIESRILLAMPIILFPNSAHVGRMRWVKNPPWAGFI